MIKIVAALALGAFASAAHGAEMYRCVIDGKTTFSDRPCAPQAEKVRVQPNQIGTGDSMDDVRAKVAASRAKDAATREAQEKADAAAYEQQRREFESDRAYREQVRLRKVIEAQNRPAANVIPYSYFPQPTTKK